MDTNHKLELIIINQRMMFNYLLAALLVAASHVTSTSPCLKLVSIGDWGTLDFSTSGLNQRADAITAASGLSNCQKRAQALLLLGDAFYPDGPYNDSDPEWDTLYVNQFNLPNLWSVPHYVIAGNHDWYSQPGYPAGNKGDKAGPKFLGVVSELDWGERLSGKGTPWIFPSLNYTRTITEDGVTVFLAFIDSWTMSNGTYTHTGESGVWGDVNGQLPWLASVLDSDEAKNADWRIVVGHYEIRSTRYPNPATNAYLKYMEPLFLEKDVHAYFCGHFHQMNVIQTTGKNGLTYYVNGAGGKQDLTYNPQTPGLVPETYIYQTPTQSRFAFMSHVFTKSQMITKIHQVNPANDIEYVQVRPTPSPTPEPTTLSPTPEPTTTSPSEAPTTASPSEAPTFSPTQRPTTSAPSLRPTHWNRGKGKRHSS